MRFIFLFKAFFVLAWFIPGQATAQMCVQMFAESKKSTKPWVPANSYVPHTNQLNPETLAKYKLALSEDKSVLLNLDTVSGEPKVLGKILISDAEYLFEWASLEEHKEWMLNKGITKSHMAAILDSEPQFAGRGFYVSVDPIDSSTYGNTLTAFRSQGPVVILEFTSYGNDFADTAKVKILSKAGIDAIRYQSYEKKWLSVISHRQLIKPESAPLSVFENVVSRTNYESPGKAYAALVKFPKSFWKKLPSDHLVRRLQLNEEMTLAQLAAIKKPFTASENEMSYGIPANLQNSYLVRLFEHALKAKNPQELFSVVEISQGLIANSKHIDFFKKKIQKLNPNPTYQANFLLSARNKRTAITQIILTAWVELAKDEQDFILRSQVATQVFNQANPESKP